jgi:hypothetical protein
MDGIYSLCPACTKATAYRVGQLIGEMYADLPDTSTELTLACRTCGRRIMELHDVFMVEYLRVSA